ncbi:hypothetical protein BS78_01G322200 [Paspalum vaginatum]|nr:hypothetical protein BS78_01G322200 [Paspalum vaginatum]
MAPRSDYPVHTEASVSADGGTTTASTSSSSVKPGCMIELARLAKIPPPESGLMCPRCHSTNTKFCYYNNYSLSQPRHFCKTCRRYWTHGGAIRDIPLASSIRRRLTKSSSKHTTASTSKAAACAAASATGRTPSCSSSGAAAAAVPTSGRLVDAVAAAATTLQPPLVVAPFGPLCAERLTSGSLSRRLWFPGHSSQDPVPVHYHQLGNRRGAAATAIRLDEQQCWYLPKSQQFSFLSYKNGVIAPATASAVAPFSAEFGGAEAAGFAAGQMKAVSRVPGSSSSSSSSVASSVMMMEETPHPQSTNMGAALTISPRQVMGLHQQGEDDELHYFLGSGGSWTCGYGGGSSVTGSGGTAAPGNVWAEDPGQASFTSSTSWNIL